MPLTPQLADYSDKDFDSIKLRLRNLVRSVFPEWTDFNVADFGNILLELFAQVGDILTFYQDNQARQSRIITATQRKAILGLVKLIAFTPSTASAATASLTITLPVPPVGIATWPAGTFVLTQDASNPVRYQLLADAVIGAGANPATVTVDAENSESEEQLFASSGLPNQTVVLSAVPYIDGSTVVIASNGAYSQVDNLLDSTPTDLHYTITVDQNDRATVLFGNGINGALPIGSGTIDYKTGGGAAGRVEQNKLKVFEQSTWIDSLGNPLSPSVTNIAQSVGGADRQSVAQIQERGPASLRVLTRTVAREDYVINAERLPSVARALMLSKDEDPGVAENAGDLYIVPVGGGIPTDDLKAQVFTMVTVTFPNTLTFKVTVRDPVYRAINVAMVVYFRVGATKSVVAAAIRANLVAFFAIQNTDGSSNTAIDFGANLLADTDGTISAELALTDVLNVCRDTTGVRKVGPGPGDFTLNGAQADILLDRKEFPALGTVAITDGDSGATL